METYRAASNWLRCGSKFSFDVNLAQIELDDSIDVCLLSLVAVFISLILDGLKVDLDSQVTGLVERIADHGGLLDRFQNGFEKIVEEIDSKLSLGENSSNSSNFQESILETPSPSVVQYVPRKFPISKNLQRRTFIERNKNHQVKKKTFDDSKIGQDDLEAYHRVKSLLTNITDVLNEKKATQNNFTPNQADAKSKDIIAITNTSEINPKDKLPITKDDIKDYMRVYSVFNRITGSKHKQLNHILTANRPKPISKPTPHPLKLKHKPTQSPLKQMPTTIYPIISSTRPVNKQSDQLIFSASQQFDPSNFLTLHNIGPIEKNSKTQTTKPSNSYPVRPQAYVTNKKLPSMPTPLPIHKKLRYSTRSSIHHSISKVPNVHIRTTKRSTNKPGAFMNNFWGEVDNDFNNDFFSPRSGLISPEGTNRLNSNFNVFEKPNGNFDFDKDFFKQETTTFPTQRSQQRAPFPQIKSRGQKPSIKKDPSTFPSPTPSQKFITRNPLYFSNEQRAPFPQIKSRGQKPSIKKDPSPFLSPTPSQKFITRNPLYFSNEQRAPFPQIKSRGKKPSIKKVPSPFLSPTPSQKFITRNPLYFTSRPSKITRGPVTPFPTRNPDIYDRMQDKKDNDFGKRKFQITFTKAPIRSSPDLAKYPNTKTRPKITTSISPWGYAQTVTRRTENRNLTQQTRNWQNNNFFPDMFDTYNDNKMTKTTTDIEETTMTPKITPIHLTTESNRQLTQDELVKKMVYYSDIGDFLKVQSILDQIQSMELSKQNPQFSTIRPRNHNYKTTPTRRIESPTSAKVEEVETAFLNFTNSPKLDILAERDELEANKNGQIFKKNSQQDLFEDPTQQNPGGNKTGDIASETISAVYDLLQDYQMDNGEEISQIQKYPYTDLEEGREKTHDIEDSYFDVEDFTESSDYYENFRKNQDQYANFDGSNENMYTERNLDQLENGITEADLEAHSRVKDVLTKLSERAESNQSDEIDEENIPTEYVNIYELIKKTVGTTQLVLKELSRLEHTDLKTFAKVNTLLGKDLYEEKS